MPPIHFYFLFSFSGLPDLPLADLVLAFIPMGSFVFFSSFQPAFPFLPLG
jgi:hypothetical protein